MEKPFLNKSGSKVCYHFLQVHRVVSLLLFLGLSSPDESVQHADLLYPIPAH